MHCTVWASMFLGFIKYMAFNLGPFKIKMHRGIVRQNGHGMGLQFYGLRGECGFYGAAPCGTLLHEVSHRSAPGTPKVEGVSPGDAWSPLL